MKGKRGGNNCPGNLGLEVSGSAFVESVRLTQMICSLREKRNFSPRLFFSPDLLFFLLNVSLLFSLRLGFSCYSLTSFRRIPLPEKQRNVMA